LWAYTWSQGSLGSVLDPSAGFFRGYSKWTLVIILCQVCLTCLFQDFKLDPYFAVSSVLNELPSISRDRYSVMLGELSMQNKRNWAKVTKD